MAASVARSGGHVPGAHGAARSTRTNERETVCVSRVAVKVNVLPLEDRVGANIRVLFVGINPGIRSAALGHHFAGYSNRFWKLLFDSKLLPEPIGTEDDHRLPEWGFGITNLVPRPTPGIDTLRPQEFADGVRTLRRKVRRWRPEVVALVGVTLARVLFDRRADRIPLGLQRETFEGARVFVLPNPSGRNANFSYSEMLAAFRALKRFLAIRGCGDLNQG
jgi:TDG/mug DNA glycosylase family protein